MNILEYKGNALLNESVIEDIQKQADLIVSEKDVASAWRAAMHLKKEILGMDQGAVAPILPKYRAISTKLKSLALPLLDQKEVENFLANNLDFLDTQTENLASQGLTAYIASQPEQEQEAIARNLSKAVDKNSMFGPKILAVLTRKGETFSKGLTFAERPQDNSINDDESDLKKAQEKIQELSPSASVDQQAQTIAQNMFSQSGSTRPEQDFARRAHALVLSRLKDVRTKTDMAEYLSRPFEVGGLGLSGQALESAQKMIEDGYNRVHSVSPKMAEISQNNQKTEKSITEKGKTFSKDLTLEKEQAPQDNTPKAAQSEIDRLIKEDSSKGFDLESILKSKPKKSDTKSPSETQSQSASAKPSIPISEPQAHQARRPIQRPAPENKVRLDDIKATFSPAHGAQSGREEAVKVPISSNHVPVQMGRTKPVGLSGEFSSFDIADFRSFGSSEQAAEKILSKIKSLEMDSFSQKYAAIRNFRSSPLDQQYMSIGEASLTQGKKLLEALADPAVNPDKLTQDEFFAISDLNGKLK